MTNTATPSHDAIRLLLDAAHATLDAQLAIESADDYDYADDSDLRSTLIERDERDDSLAIALQLIERYERDYFTELALSLSLCPLHTIDYAICFDDNDAECAAIRTIHPSHDT